MITSLHTGIGSGILLLYSLQNRTLPLQVNLGSQDLTKTEWSLYGFTHIDASANGLLCSWWWLNYHFKKPTSNWGFGRRRMNHHGKESLKLLWALFFASSFPTPRICNLKEKARKAKERKCGVKSPPTPHGKESSCIVWIQIGAWSPFSLCLSKVALFLS